MKLGARIFKTAVAVVLSLYISQWLDLNSGFLAAIAAVLTIKPSIQGSFTHMKEQFVSNGLGAAFAFTGLFLFGDSPFVIGLVIVIVIITNVHFKNSSSSAIAVVTVIAIMGIGESNEMMFAFNRFLAIFIGIFCAILVNAIFLPPKYEKKLVDKIKLTHSEIAFLLKNAFHNALEKNVYSKEIAKIESDVKETNTLYGWFKDEQQIRWRKPKYSELRKLVVIKNLDECLYLEHRVLLTLTRHIRSVNEANEELKHEINQQIYSLVDFQEQLFFKYEKKLKTDYTLEEPEVVEQQNRHLLEGIVKQFKQNESSIYLFPIISSIIEWSDQLEYTEKCINRYHNYHQKKRD